MNQKNPNQPQPGHGGDSKRAAGDSGDRSKTPASDKNRPGENRPRTDRPEQQRMDDDGAPRTQPNQPGKSDTQRRPGQPGAPLPSGGNMVPGGVPDLGDQEPGDPRRGKPEVTSSSPRTTRRDEGSSGEPRRS